MAKSNKKVAIETKIVKPTVSPKFGIFKNVTKRNIFTTVGRIMAGDKLELPMSEGNNAVGLELV